MTDVSSQLPIGRTNRVRARASLLSPGVAAFAPTADMYVGSDWRASWRASPRAGQIVRASELSAARQLARQITRLLTSCGRANERAGANCAS